MECLYTVRSLIPLNRYWYFGVGENFDLFRYTNKNLLKLYLPRSGNIVRNIISEDYNYHNDEELASGTYTVWYEIIRPLMRGRNQSIS